MRLILQYGEGNLPQLLPHKNPGLEIIYLSSGQLRWQTEGRVEMVLPDSVFFTLPWEKHGSAEEYEPGHRWHFVVLALDRNYPKPCKCFALHPSLGFSPVETRQIVNYLTSATRHGYPAGPTLRWMLPSLVHELQRPQCMSKTYVATLARACVLELCRLIENASFNGRDHNRNGCPGSLQELVQRIVENPEEVWSLGRLASACRLRRSRFSVLFHKATGDSPITFVNRMRIAKARRLLRESSHSITRIAQDCGFATSQYFAREFRVFTGIDARTYRASKACKF